MFQSGKLIHATFIYVLPIVLGFAILAAVVAFILKPTEEVPDDKPINVSRPNSKGKAAKGNDFENQRRRSSESVSS